MTTYPYKHAISEAIINSDRTAIIKSRQVGMTSIALDIALTEASTKKDFVTVFFTKRLFDADLLYRKAIQQITVAYTISAQHTISFDGFGTIYFLPATEKVAKKFCLGKRIGLAIVDEAAFVEDLDRILMLLYPAIDKMVLFSTPYRKSGAFHEAINAGESDLKARLKAACNGNGFEQWTESGWTKIAVHYKANPNYDPTFKERCKLTQEQWDNEFELGFT